MKSEFIGRAVVREYDDILKIKIPARKILPILILFVILISWFHSEIFALKIIFFSNDIYLSAKIIMLVWTVIWTIIGLFILIILSWFLIGYELIIVGNGNLKIIKKIGFISIKKEYKTREIKDISLTRIGTLYIETQSIVERFGEIKFDYNMKTVKFGYNINEIEAKMIVEKLKRNHNFREYNFAIITNYKK
ncbi:hypothetical protein [Oceanivirga salmonicida]|uniref:hypothetical protein n=1 Tax=Oceanivirga salmonicida TaxID=1769291 RepID=UPI00082A3438|nr:hypothetical protein [Oceanivirga salmonicida]